MVKENTTEETHTTATKSVTGYETEASGES